MVLIKELIEFIVPIVLFGIFIAIVDLLESKKDRKGKNTMALIECPECGKQISDKSKVCIHCGYPIEEMKSVSLKLDNEHKMDRVCPYCNSKSIDQQGYCNDCGMHTVIKENNTEKKVKKKKKKRGGCGNILWFVLIIVLVLLVFQSNKDSVDMSFGGQELGDFDYNIDENKIFIKGIENPKSNFEIKSTYEKDGKKYDVDLSEFQVGIGNDKVLNIAFNEGVSDLNISVFNSCDVETIYLPETLNLIYDYTLNYLHSDEGKVKVFYGGTKEDWDSIYQLYERKNIDDIINSSNDVEEKAKQIGSSIADKLNSMMVSSEELEFEIIFNTTIEEYRTIVMGE